MITKSIQAKWLVFNRLYISRYNNFLHRAPIGFKELLQELGIPSCKIMVHRRQCVLFELPEELQYTEFFSEDDKDLIIENKSVVSTVIMQVAAYYKDFPTNSISEYEAYLLSGWLGFDVGRYMIVNYYDRNKP